MKIEITQEPDPQSNIIEFTRAKREPNIKIERRGYSDCLHPRTTVHESTRTVTCSICGTLLDAFTVLWEMATKQRRWLDDLEAWEARRDTMLSERYDLEWARRSGDIKEPPQDSQLREIWNTFYAVMGDKFCGMYLRKKRKRTGPLWYGRNIHGSCISLDYARSLLSTRIPVNAGQESK